MDYKFNKLDTDKYELVYKNINKEEVKKQFTVDVEIAKKLQEINKRARLLMFKELTAEGITKNDLVVKKVTDDGKTIYDETNYKMYEEEYMKIAQLQIVNEIYEKLFGMNFAELFVDMGVNEATSEKEAEKFSQELSAILLGINNQDDVKTPSK